MKFKMSLFSVLMLCLMFVSSTFLLTACDNSSQPSLYFKLNEGRKSYSVAGIGSVTDTEIVIPEEYKGLPVTSIGEGAFSGRKITSVTIPESVTSIGEDAFYGCSKLTSITIPESVTSIGDDAFANSYLDSITIPSKVTYIGTSAFGDCISLNEVYWNAFDCTTAGSSACPIFQRCISLTKVVIGDNVQTIPRFAFYDCSSLRSIIIPAGVSYIGDRAFCDCEMLTIYCEASSKRLYWDEDWNYSHRPVVWGYKEEK